MIEVKQEKKYLDYMDQIPQKKKPRAHSVHFIPFLQFEQPARSNVLHKDFSAYTLGLTIFFPLEGFRPQYMFGKLSSEWVYFPIHQSTSNSIQLLPMGTIKISGQLLYVPFFFHSPIQALAHPQILVYKPQFFTFTYEVCRTVFNKLH